MLHLFGVITHFIALVYGFLSVKKFSDIFQDRRCPDVNLDYYVLVISIIMNTLIIYLLIDYVLNPHKETLRPIMDISFAIYHTTNGLIVSYWHSGMWSKYKKRLGNG